VCAWHTARKQGCQGQAGNCADRAYALTGGRPGAQHVDAWQEVRCPSALLHYAMQPPTLRWQALSNTTPAMEHCGAAGALLMAHAWQAASPAGPPGEPSSTSKLVSLPAALAHSSWQASGFPSTLHSKRTPSPAHCSRGSRAVQCRAGWVGSGAMRPAQQQAGVKGEPGVGWCCRQGSLRHCGPGSRQHATHLG
jgi:hypothetical protein